MLSPSTWWYRNSVCSRGPSWTSAAANADLNSFEYVRFMYSTSGSSCAIACCAIKLIVIDEDLALALAQIVEARPHRDRAHPAPQIAAATVLGDLAGARRRTGGATADEQPLAHELLDVGQPRRADAHARERDVDLAHVVAIERLDRAPVSRVAHAHAR